ncbi:MAG: WecB/TagA/CpsF family glycosyltransferase [Clostridia bacterium]|nr:WecB/TagA/CpsF family glycosyltransferase [Clostridia bacterium]
MEGIGPSPAKVNVLGVAVDKLTLNEALQRVEAFLKEDRLHLIVTANPEIIMLARQDEQFAKILEQADLVTADGIGLVIGARILGEDLPERVTGIDLSSGIFRLAREKGWSFYLLGAAPGVAEAAAAQLVDKYPGLKITGWNHGYFQDSEPILREIEARRPDILLVALGMGRQEKWVWEHGHRLPVKLAIGVGGSLDVYAGRVQRAPELFQRLGLEWLYRLVRQPSRLGRMLVLPVFLWKVLKAAIF